MAKRTKKADGEPLTVAVKDFGPIAEGKVELRPLTIFVGPSNSGKSWLASLIYALHRHFFSTFHAWGYEPMSLSIGLPGFELFNTSAESKDAGRIDDFLEEILNSSGQAFSPSSGMRKLISDQFQQQSDKIDMQLRHYLGISESERGQLIRWQADRLAQIELLMYGQAVKGTLSISSTSFESELQIEDDFYLSIPASDTENMRQVHEFEASPQKGRGAFRSFFGYFPFVTTVRPLLTPAHYLPAGRTGILAAHAAIVSALLDHASWEGPGRSPEFPLMSGIPTDFLKGLVQIHHAGRAKESRPTMNESAEALEREILKGSVELDDSSPYHPRFIYRPADGKEPLPLMRASSMVTELAPVVLYLRYLVEPGDLVIIEEPESHLHPAAQVKFIQHIAQLVRQGVRVIVTTHSEIVMEEITNILGRGKLPATDKPRKAALLASDVGVWLFDTDSESSGTTIREAQADEETGLHDTGFDEVGMALHNNWADIYNELDKAQ